jgi:hypothetical protein
MVWLKNKLLSPAACKFRDYMQTLVDHQVPTKVFNAEQANLSDIVLME